MNVQTHVLLDYVRRLSNGGINSPCFGSLRKSNQVSLLTSLAGRVRRVLQFSLQELLVLVGGLALCTTALRFASPALASVVLVLSIGSIVLALVFSVRVRASLVSYSLIAFAYLLFAHFPDSQGCSPRQYGNEPTTKVLRLFYNWTHDVLPIESQLDGVSVAFERDYESPSRNLASSLWPPPRDMPTYIPLVERRQPFMQIGHCLLAVVFGLIFAKFFRKSNT